MSDEKEFRYFQAKADDLDEGPDGRTLTVSFSSETPVLRTDQDGVAYYEVLSHAGNDADLAFLQGSGALLLEHDERTQIGSVQRAWIESRKGRAVISLADTDKGRETFQLMEEGHRRDLSVGYRRTKLIGESRHADGKPIRRFKWKALEVSSTYLGADHYAVGVGRSQENLVTETRNMNAELQKEITEISKVLTHENPHVADKISDMKTRALLEDTPLQQFKRNMSDMLTANPKPRQFYRATESGRQIPVSQAEALGRSEHSYMGPNLAIGMDERDLGQYSIVRAIRSITQGNKLDGFERDCHEQCERNSGMRAEGFFVPLEAAIGAKVQRNLGYGRRDLFTGDFGSGGALVPELLESSIVELLRNKTTALRLGAMFLGGLTGNVAVPRQTSPATAANVGEIDVLPQSQAVFDQIKLQPHRLGAFTVLSKQLILQSTPGVESLVLSDLAEVISIANDSMALNGTGANDQPLGILNTPGIGQVTFGATATSGKVVSFETTLGNANADRGQMAFVSTPSVKGAWKTIGFALSGATVVATKPLWDVGNFGDGSNDGVVNGYRAASTKQIPNDKVLFGNFNDLIFAQWGGYDLVVNIYSRAKQAEVEITVNEWIDVALRHPQSFCLSTDSGNQ